MPLIDLPFNRLASPTLYYPIRRGLRVWWWHLLQFSKASRGPFGSKDNSCPRSYRYHRHTTMMAVIIIIRESITHGWLDELSSRHYYEARISRRIDNLVKVRWSQRKHKSLFRKQRFEINFFVRQNASKFAIFIEKENPRSFFRFSFRAFLSFPLWMPRSMST